MSVPDPVLHFVRALASAALNAAPLDEAVEQAATALEASFRSQRSLVLDVQFTGFVYKGELAAIEPALLRAAGHLIVLRVTRVGVTAEASRADLRALFGVLGAAPSELGTGGAVGALRSESPAGVYLSTATETYRPVTGSSGSTTGVKPEDGETELTDFEILDVLPDIEAAPAASELKAGRADEEGGMYNFFRAAGGDEDETGQVVAALETEESLSRYDELLQQTTARVRRSLERGSYDEAALLLAAVARETERSDRSRVFRDAAIYAIRAVGRGETLQQLMGLIEAGGQRRREMLRILPLFGREVTGMMEGMLFRTKDVDLRCELFLSLVRQEGMEERILLRAMDDGEGDRSRAVLELPALSKETQVALRWAERVAGHSDPAIRLAAVRNARTAGGRGAVRILVDLLGDTERRVQRAAIAGLGEIADPAGVSFLSRLVSESGDEEIQMDAITALGRIGSTEAVGPLVTLIQKRQLLGGKRLARLKASAIQALGRMPARAAREALVTLRDGRDKELASEARQALLEGSRVES